MQVPYPKSDSLNILRPQTDTVQLVLRRRPAEKKKKKKKDEPDPIVFLGMQVDAPGSMDLFDTISVTFNERYWISTKRCSSSTKRSIPFGIR